MMMRRSFLLFVLFALAASGSGAAACSTPHFSLHFCHHILQEVLAYASARKCRGMKREDLVHFPTAGNGWLWYFLRHGHAPDWQSEGGVLLSWMLLEVLGYEDVEVMFVLDIAMQLLSVLLEQYTNAARVTPILWMKLVRFEDGLQTQVCRGICHLASQGIVHSQLSAHAAALGASA